MSNLLVSLLWCALGSLFGSMLHGLVTGSNRLRFMAWVHGRAQEAFFNSGPKTIPLHLKRMPNPRHFHPGSAPVQDLLISQMLRAQESCLGVFDVAFWVLKEHCLAQEIVLGGKKAVEG